MQRLLIALLFIAPTIQYRIDVGPFSLALMEPIILGVASVLLLGQIWQRGSIFLAREPLLGLMLLICVWVLLIRPFEANITRGLSDARDWVVPTIGYLALLATVRTGWRQWILIFVIGVFLQASLGIYQAWSDSARPFVNDLAVYKQGFVVTPEADRLLQTSFASGLFGHPNAMAIYLLGGFMLALSWPVQHRWSWVVKFVLLALIGGSLYLTYAKSSLLVLGLAVGWYLLQHWLRSGRRLFGMTIIGGGLILILLGVVIPLIPEVFLRTFYWRVGLWQIAWDQLAAYPTTLIFGNGLDRFAQIAYYAQPHNTYIFMLLEYGIFGLIWLLALLWQLARLGWYARIQGFFRLEPRLAGLWVFLLSYAVLGITESTLHGIEDRALLLWYYACFFGLYREVASELVRARVPEYANLQPVATRQAMQHLS
jgi:hypothetical protein